MKTKNNNELLNDINSLLSNKETSQQEVQILLIAKRDLDKNVYLPKVTSFLRTELTPLAIKSKLSKGVSELYLKITSHKYMDKGFGGGLITTGLMGGF